MFEIIYHHNATDCECGDRWNGTLAEAIEWAKSHVRDGEHWYIVDAFDEIVAEGF